MSHKDAPPLIDEQIRFEQWWRERKPHDYIGFGRDKRGAYQAEFARDAWAAWIAAQERILDGLAELRRESEMLGETAPQK